MEARISYVVVVSETDDICVINPKKLRDIESPFGLLVSRARAG